MINRRNFLWSAAAAPAVLKTNATAGVKTPFASKPVEADLVHPDSKQHLHDPSVDLFVRLEEEDAGDPGQLSGAALRILDTGSSMYVVAETAAPQRDGSMHSHCWGALDAQAAAVLITPPADGVSTIVPLRDPAERFTGAWIEISAEEERELRLLLPTHVFGVLRGPGVVVFLRALETRLEE